jgi:hypothetical protein
MGAGAGATGGWQIAAVSVLSPNMMNAKVAGPEATQATVMPALAAATRPKRAADEMIKHQNRIRPPVIL